MVIHGGRSPDLKYCLNVSCADATRDFLLHEASQKGYVCLCISMALPHNWVLGQSATSSEIESMRIFNSQLVVYRKYYVCHNAAEKATLMRNACMLCGFAD